MRAFVDVDIVKKLSACGLLDRWTEIMPDATGPCCLDSTPHMLARFAKKPDRSGYRLPSEALAMGQGFCRSCTRLGTVALDDPILLRHAATPGMNGGELQLLAAACRTPGAILITGDKRFLKSLNAEMAAGRLPEAVGVKIRCLEQVIQAATAALGFPVVSACVKGGRDCDGALRNAWGHAHQHGEAEVAAALTSLVAETTPPPGVLEDWP